MVVCHKDDSLSHTQVFDSYSINVIAGGNCPFSIFTFSYCKSNLQVRYKANLYHLIKIITVLHGDA